MQTPYMLHYLVWFMSFLFAACSVFAQSIEGTLLMLDDKTPHVAVPVQAISDGKVIVTTLSDEEGKYLFVNLKSSLYQVRCQILGGYVYYGTGKEQNKQEGEFLQVKKDQKLSDIDFRFPPFKKGTWKNYDTLDGLAHNAVSDIYRDANGRMWLTTEGGGVSCYNGEKFVNFTTQDGLAHNIVRAISGTPDGVMWFGTGGGGVSRYDGKMFLNFTVKDDLAHDRVYDIHCTSDSVVWFATRGGVSRYDEFVSGASVLNAKQIPPAPFPLMDGLLFHQSV